MDPPRGVSPCSRLAGAPGSCRAGGRDRGLAPPSPPAASVTSNAIHSGVIAAPSTFPRSLLLPTPSVLFIGDYLRHQLLPNVTFTFRERYRQAWNVG